MRADLLPARIVAPRRSGQTRSLLVGWFLVFALFYMIAFPKGGLKVQDIPVTIGYLLVVPTALIGALYQFGRRIPFEHVVIITAAFALAAWSAAVVRLYGGQTGGFVMAYFVSVLVLPIWAIFLFNGNIMSIYGDRIFFAIRIAIRFVAAYGIFLFLYKYLTGNWIEIPYVTLNVADVGGLDEKHINRGGVFKLISTYNNGNIFGVCMAMLLPMYFKLEKSWIFRALIIVAMILTLSRTVWIGLLLVGLFAVARAGLRPLHIALGLAGIGLFILGGLGAMYVAGLDMKFLTDTQLGGRLEQFSVLADAGFLPHGRGEDLPEIVYLGIIKNYGYIGLALFLLFLGSPILLLRRLGVRLNQDRLAARAQEGLVVYLVLAMSDAAFNYIPVMMIYWMVAAIGLWLAAPNLRLTAR